MTNYSSKLLKEVLDKSSERNQDKNKKQIMYIWAKYLAKYDVKHYRER